MKKKATSNELANLIAGELGKISGEMHSPLIVEAPGENPNWRTLHRPPSWARESIERLRAEYDVSDDAT